MYIFCVILFLLPHELLYFFRLGHDRLRPNENEPLLQTSDNALHTSEENVLWLLDKIYSSSSGGRSFSIFKLQACSLIEKSECFWMRGKEDGKKED